jgi:hypothetical protein
LTQKRREQIKRFNEQLAAKEPFQEITLATPKEFKGFENSYICLVDNQDIGSQDRENSALYVALSRARAGLWITFPRKIEGKIKQIITANLEATEEAGWN